MEPVDTPARAATSLSVKASEPRSISSATAASTALSKERRLRSCFGSRTTKVPSCTWRPYGTAPPAAPMGRLGGVPTSERLGQGAEGAADQLLVLRPVLRRIDLPLAELQRRLDDQLAAVEAPRHERLQRRLHRGVAAQLLGEHDGVLDRHAGAIRDVRRGGVRGVPDEHG